MEGDTGKEDGDGHKNTSMHTTYIQTYLYTHIYASKHITRLKP